MLFFFSTRSIYLQGYIIYMSDAHCVTVLKSQIAQLTEE